ncbi:MAG TPA: hypothetical protein DCO72_05165 [Ruminococcus sp.]|nr:hypothetical protein [Ruminococcus sp.]
MKVLREGDKKIVQLIAQKNIDTSAKYRLSDFVYDYSENDVFLIQHTMSGQVIRLTEQEWNVLHSIQFPVEENFISENGLELLVRNRYLVENDYNEQKKYLSVVELLRMMDGKKGLKTYTILPTTGCNARCTYCYEANFIPKNMTKETADKVVEYILRTKWEDKIKLHWFGGEPLVGHQIISYICQSLAEKGVEFESTMISNAALLTEKMADEAKNLWHLKRIQVSLDGERNDYEARKCYVNPKIHHYDRVMQSIHLLADRGIKVNLRCNYDWENLPRLKQFLDEIKAEFDNIENISIYFSTLYQERKKENCIELIQKKFELMDYCREIGITSTDRKRGNSKYQMRLNLCMADSMNRSILIDPEGKFFDCEHLPRDSYGNVTDGIDETYFQELARPHKIADECSHCHFLPICTPFYRKGCPGWFAKCRENRQLSADYALHRIVVFLTGENNS